MPYITICLVITPLLHQWFYYISECKLTQIIKCPVKDNKTIKIRLYGYLSNIDSELDKYIEQRVKHIDYLKLQENKNLKQILFNYEKIIT